MTGIKDYIKFIAKKLETLSAKLEKLSVHLLNIEPCNSVFVKTYTTEFDDVIFTFTYQNGRLLAN